jgi:hypothetical protein
VGATTAQTMIRITTPRTTSDRLCWDFQRGAPGAPTQGGRGNLFFLHDNLPSGARCAGRGGKAAEPVHAGPPGGEESCFFLQTTSPVELCALAGAAKLLSSCTQGPLEHRARVLPLGRWQRRKPKGPADIPRPGRSTTVSASYTMPSSPATCQQPLRPRSPGLTERVPLQDQRDHPRGSLAGTLAAVVGPARWHCALSHSPAANSRPELTPLCSRCPSGQPLSTQAPAVLVLCVSGSFF